MKTARLRPKANFANRVKVAKRRNPDTDDVIWGGDWDNHSHCLKVVLKRTKLWQPPYQGAK